MKLRLITRNEVQVLPKKHEPDQPGGGTVINLKTQYWEGPAPHTGSPIDCDKMCSVCATEKPLGP